MHLFIDSIAQIDIDYNIKLEIFFVMLQNRSIAVFSHKKVHIVA